MPTRSIAPTLLAAVSLCLAACTTDAPVSVPAMAKSPDHASLARASGPSVQHVATTSSDVMATAGNVTIFQSGYGSAIALVPGTSRDFYLLTDRGPNIDGVPNTIKKFPVPSYTPRIYRAHFGGSNLRIDGEIILKRPNGITPLTGLPITPGQCGATLETA